jgi:hypothetical protein
MNLVATLNQCHGHGSFVRWCTIGCAVLGLLCKDEGSHTFANLTKYPKFQTLSRCTALQVCHVGKCGVCPFSGIRSCPCGKQTYDGMSCADKVPTCGETCGKLLPCGVHRCQDRCHQGECTAQCRGPALKSCRCGALDMGNMLRRAWEWGSLREGVVGYRESAAPSVA